MRCTTVVNYGVACSDTKVEYMYDMQTNFVSIIHVRVFDNTCSDTQVGDSYCAVCFVMNLHTKIS